MTRYDDWRLDSPVDQPRHPDDCDCPSCDPDGHSERLRELREDR